MNERSAGLRACAGDILRSRRIDAVRGLAIALRTVHGGIGRAIYDEGAWTHDVRKRGRIGNVAFGSAQCAMRHACAVRARSQRTANLAMWTDDQEVAHARQPLLASR